MLTAGGGFRAGQVINSWGGQGLRHQRTPQTPPDLAATSSRHLGVDRACMARPQWRPIPIVTEGGQPIPELRHRVHSIGTRREWGR